MFETKQVLGKLKNWIGKIRKDDTKIIMKKLITIVTMFSLCVQLTGCAAVTAIRQPGQKNLQVLNHGMSRENVITHLGAPVSSEKENGKTIDIYQFKQGYSGANKASRAVVHIAADFFTFFIWEIIGWPAELIFNGNNMTVKVTYDQDKRIEDATFLKKEK